MNLLFINSTNDFFHLKKAKNLLQTFATHCRAYSFCIHRKCSKHSAAVLLLHAHSSRRLLARNASSPRQPLIFPPTFPLLLSLSYTFSTHFPPMIRIPFNKLARIQALLLRQNKRNNTESGKETKNQQIVYASSREKCEKSLLTPSRIRSFPPKRQLSRMSWNKCDMKIAHLDCTTCRSRWVASSSPHEFWKLSTFSLLLHSHTSYRFWWANWELIGKSEQFSPEWRRWWWEM